MNIGIRLHDTLPGTMEQRLAFAKAQGFTCVHLAMSKTVPGFRMEDAPELLTPALAESVRAALAEHGLECAVLGCYLKLPSRDPEELKRVQAVYRAHLSFAKWIGARVVGTETPPADSLGWGAEEKGSEEALSLLIDCLRPIVGWAEEVGMPLAIEPVCEHIVSTPERAKQVLEAIASPQLRIILDAVNLLAAPDIDRVGEIVDHAIDLLADHTEVLHMKDCIFAPGKPRPVASACGTGSMRYDSLLALAKRRGLPMTLENTTPENAEGTRLYLESLAAAL